MMQTANRLTENVPDTAKIQLYDEMVDNLITQLKPAERLTLTRAANRFWEGRTFDNLWGRRGALPFSQHARRLHEDEKYRLCWYAIVGTPQV